MASVKVAVRVRPFNKREVDMDAKLILKMDGKLTQILCPVKGMSTKYSDNSNRCFTYDYSYWSFDPKDHNYISQDQVYRDLGIDVVDAAFEGYNACVFAYGQTGSGKTYTMMGSEDERGLIPRICESLFKRMEQDANYRIEVSYLEIYNEKVRDLLQKGLPNNLKIRQHPVKGACVTGLSCHLVSEYADIQELMARGNSQRATASTNMNSTSSRSHAIFTLMFVQAHGGFSNDIPQETVSKINLVDLAGSERADTSGATGERLKEGAHINKSLVTLGLVISTLAELCSSDNKNRTRGPSKNVFIPYRDSVLTWLLKDSLGGNSKTFMIAAVSPADCNYAETLSTLRYASRAKNIINSPRINEDENVKLIRELRDEITKLKAMLSNEYLKDVPAHMSQHVLAELEEKEAQEQVLRKEWAEKWKETQKVLQEQKAIGLRKYGAAGVVLDSDMPHLIGIDDSPLSTGVTLYHLKEGETVIGSSEADIVLKGEDVKKEHCGIILNNGVATIIPRQNCYCWVNGLLINKPTRLSQGCNILLGSTNMFRYNDPSEVEKLRSEGKSSSAINLTRLSLLSWSTPDLARSMGHNSPQSLNSSMLLTNNPLATSSPKISNPNANVIGSYVQLHGCLSDMSMDQSDIFTSSETLDEDCFRPSIKVGHQKSSRWHSFYDSDNSATYSDITRKIKPLLRQIKRQRLFIMSCIESDACTNEIDQHILRLQELKKEYVKLEQQLQEDHKENLKFSTYEPVQQNSDSDEEFSTTSTEDGNRVFSCSILNKYSQSNPCINNSNFIRPMQEFDSTSDIIQTMQDYDTRILQGRLQMSLNTSFGNLNTCLNFENSDLRACSMPSLNRLAVWDSSQLNNEAIVITVPSYLLRGAGRNTHFVYEVCIRVDGEKYMILRRYRKFRELHLTMMHTYKEKISKIHFPPRIPWRANTERVAKERRAKLESYLQKLISICSVIETCPLYNCHSKDALLKFSPFFKRGTFETSKFDTV